MTSKKPSISIAIPTFNRLQYLKQTLKSVFRQSTPADEVIVIDNHSTDGTWEYLMTLKDQITIYRNPRNIGSFANIEKALHVPTSDYVVALGSDDLLLPAYVESMKTLLKRKHPDVLLCASYVIDSNNSVRGLLQPSATDCVFMPPKGLRVYHESFFPVMLLTGSTVFKRSVLQELGSFNNLYGRCVENVLTLQILERYCVYYTAKILSAKRHHMTQGFEYEENDRIKQQDFIDLSEAMRVLVDYNSSRAVLKAYSQKEQQQGRLIRNAVSLFLPYSVYYFFHFDFSRAKEYLKLFFTYSPKPFITGYSVLNLSRWLLFLARQYTINLFVRKQLTGKSLLDIKV